MKNRIKEADTSVPSRYNGYWYYTRITEGAQYEVHARRRGADARGALTETSGPDVTKIPMGDPGEEILLDENERKAAGGHKFYTVRRPGGSCFWGGWSLVPSRRPRASGGRLQLTGPRRWSLVPARRPARKSHSLTRPRPQPPLPPAHAPGGRPGGVSQPEAASLGGGHRRRREVLGARQGGRFTAAAGGRAGGAGALQAATRAAWPPSRRAQLAGSACRAAPPPPPPTTRHLLTFPWPPAAADRPRRTSPRARSSSSRSPQRAAPWCGPTTTPRWWVPPIGGRGGFAAGGGQLEALHGPHPLCFALRPARPINASSRPKHRPLTPTPQPQFYVLKDKLDRPYKVMRHK
jgi:hypothetical protein